MKRIVRTTGEPNGFAGSGASACGLVWSALGHDRHAAAYAMTASAKQAFPAAVRPVGSEGGTSG